MRVHTKNKRGLTTGLHAGYDFVSSVQCCVTITRTQGSAGTLVITPIGDGTFAGADDSPNTETARDLVASTDGVTLFKQVRK